MQSASIDELKCNDELIDQFNTFYDLCNIVYINFVLIQTSNHQKKRNKSILK